MKKGILAIALILGSSSAFANHEKISDSKDLTCQQAIGQVNRNGHKKFTIDGAGPFEFLSAAGADDFCTDWQNASQAWIPTADAANCPVGFTCVNK
jgi:hypothetical protein